MKTYLMLLFLFLPLAAMFGVMYATCSTDARHRDEERKAEEACRERGGITSVSHICYMNCVLEARFLECIKDGGVWIGTDNQSDRCYPPITGGQLDGTDQKHHSP